MPEPPESWNEAKNAFRRGFLRRAAGRDGEPDTATEAWASVVWRQEPHPRLGHALVHPAESPGEPPFATFFSRYHALLAQAVVPALGRDLWRLGNQEEEHGYPLLLEGAPAGYLRVFETNLVPYLIAGDFLTRNPQALAFLLEAASPVALEHAGRYLERALCRREEEGGGE